MVTINKRNKKPTGNDFRRGVVWGAAAGLHEFAVEHHVGEPEVGDLDVQVLIQQQVLWFQVPR